MKILKFEYESFIYTSGLLGKADVTYKSFWSEPKTVVAIHQSLDRTTLSQGFYIAGLWYDYSTGELLTNSLRTKLDDVYKKTRKENRKTID